MAFFGATGSRAEDDSDNDQIPDSEEYGRGLNPEAARRQSARVCLTGGRACTGRRVRMANSERK
jgi:hypothetical protein